MGQFLAALLIICHSYCSFFTGLFGGRGGSFGDCSNCQTPLDWWLMGRDIAGYFFIRGGAQISQGVGGKDYKISEGTKLASVEYSYWDNAAWWYVSM